MSATATPSSPSSRQMQTSKTGSVPGSGVVSRVTSTGNSPTLSPSPHRRASFTEQTNSGIRQQVEAEVELDTSPNATCSASPCNSGDSGVAPLSPDSSTPRFNSSSAASFFRSHLRAVAFTKRLAALAATHNVGGGGGESDGVGAGSDSSYSNASSDMSESEFARLAESLSRPDCIATLRTVYGSLTQFRTLLLEAKILSSGSELGKEETCARIVTRIRAVVGAEAVLLFMVERSNDLVYVCASSMDATNAHGTAGFATMGGFHASAHPYSSASATTSGGPISYSHNLTHSFCGHVLRYRTALNIHSNIEQDARYDPDLRRALGGRMRMESLLLVPVVNKNGNIISIIMCINKKENKTTAKSPQHHHRRHSHSHASGTSQSNPSTTGTSVTRKSDQPSHNPGFSEQDQSCVEFLSILAAQSLECSMLFEDVSFRRKQTETLLSIQEILNAEALDTKRVMQRMIEASYLLVQAERITLYMIDESTEELVPLTRPGHTHTPTNATTGDGTASRPPPPIRHSLRRGILGFSASSGKPVNCIDARLDWRFDPEVDSSPDCQTISLLVVPVTDHLSRPIAVIQAVNKRIRQSGLAPITGGSMRVHQSQSAAQTGAASASASAAALGIGSCNSPPLPTASILAHQGGGTLGVGVGGGLGPLTSMSGATPFGVGGRALTVSSGGGSTNGFMTQTPYFTRDEEKLLQSLAVSAGIILRKSKLYEEAVATRKKTEALLQISELLSADLNAQQIKNKITQAAYMLVHCECILLWMVDEAAGELVCESGPTPTSGSSSSGTGLAESSLLNKSKSSGPGAANAGRARIPLGSGVAGHTALTGRALNISDASRDWRFDPAEYASSNIMAHMHVHQNNHAAQAGAAQPPHQAPMFSKDGVSAYGTIPSVTSPTSATSPLNASNPSVAASGPSFPPLIKNRVQTILAIPIKDYLGKVNGVIECINKRDRNTGALASFGNEDEEVLGSLAYTAGAVLRKSKLFDEAIIRRKQTEALLQIQEIMSAELDSNKLMQRIIEASYTLVDAERITLFAVDPKTGDLVCQVSKDPLFQGARMGYGHGIVGHVALTRRSLNIVDAYSDPRFNQLSDLKTGFRTHAILTVPVTDRKGQAVAVIQAVNKRGGTSFSQEDVMLLESMAVNAGMLLQKTRLFDAAVIADRKSRALVSLVMTATREDASTDDIMRDISRVAYDALQADRVYFFFVDQVREEMTCIVAPDADMQASEDGWSIPLGRGLAGWAALTGELVNVEHATTHPKYDAHYDSRPKYNIKSILCQGVKNNDGEVIALVLALNKRPMARRGRDITFNASVMNMPSHSTGNNTLSSPPRPSSSPMLPPLSPPSIGGAASSSLPPLTTPPLRKHNSRSSLPNGASPAWLSLRTSSSGLMEESAANATAPVGMTNMSDIGGGPAQSPQSSPVRRGSGVFGQHGRHSRAPSTSLFLGASLSAELDALTGNNSNNHNNHAVPSVVFSPSYAGSFDADSSGVESFTAEDEEMLRAFCAEVRSLLLRHVRSTLLEMNQLSMNEGVYSLMDMFTGTVSSRASVASPTAASTHGVAGGGSGSAISPPPPFTRPGSLNRASKRRVKSHRSSLSPVILSTGGGGRSGAKDVPSVPWPIGVSSRFSELLSLEFNVWTCSPDELLVLSYEMFVEMRLVDEFQIVGDTLKNFLITVRQNYHDNPFHNWYHGFSVLHFCYLSLRLLTNASEYLTQQDVLALMVASLCHDIDHPGNTNSFEINTGSELALIHNDLSVLENHHAYTTFRILRHSSTNFLCNLRKDTFQSLKKSIVGGIMATDMLRHFTECRALDEREAMNPFNIQIPNDRQTVINLLVHSADLSAQCFPTPIASVWEERITREFEHQAAKEKALGIPVAEFMQNLSNPVLRRQNQVNFIEVVLIPWWRATTRLFPGFKACYKNLLVNRNYYANTTHATSAQPSPQALSSTVNENTNTNDTASSSVTRSSIGEDGDVDGDDAECKESSISVTVETQTEEEEQTEELSEDGVDEREETEVQRETEA